VAIDRVRVISNIASGKTGITLAKAARKMGAKVTLLLGPVGDIAISKGIEVIRFNFFVELFSQIKKELAKKDYDIVIHSAAVSDYKPKAIFGHKLKSGKEKLGLELSPTLRIIDKIKNISPKVFLVAFKLEFGLVKTKLIKEALQLLRRAKADLVVANTFSQKHYSALLINKNGRILGRANSKAALSVKLLKTIKDCL